MSPCLRSVGWSWEPCWCEHTDIWGPCDAGSLSVSGYIRCSEHTWHRLNLAEAGRTQQHFPGGCQAIPFHQTDRKWIMQISGYKRRGSASWLGLLYAGTVGHSCIFTCHHGLLSLASAPSSGEICSTPAQTLYCAVALLHFWSFLKEMMHIKLLLIYTRRRHLNKIMWVNAVLAWYWTVTQSTACIFPVHSSLL